MRADAEPPEGIHPFNTNAVLIRLLPPRMTQAPARVVGPKATKSRDGPQDVMPDPWANWQGPRPSPGPAMSSAASNRPLDGPTESRLQAQDKKLESMEQQIKQLAHAQDDMFQQTEKRFQAAELREKQHIQQVTATMDNIKTDLSRSLDNAFQKNTQVMEDRLAELKHLLLSNKRGPPPDGSMND